MSTLLHAVAVRIHDVQIPCDCCFFLVVRYRTFWTPVFEACGRFDVRRGSTSSTVVCGHDAGKHTCPTETDVPHRSPETPQGNFCQQTTRKHQLLLRASPHDQPLSYHPPLYPTACRRRQTNLNGWGRLAYSSCKDIGAQFSRPRSL